MTKKVLIIGDAGVGKSSLRAQFFKKPFSTSYRATTGANFLTKDVQLTASANDVSEAPGESESARPGLSERSSTTVSLCIWDTAGQERFNSLSPTFFRGGDGAILLYDVTDAQSLSNLVNHYRDFQQYCGTKRPVIVVAGNKVDAGPRRVSLRDARELVSREFTAQEWNGRDDVGVDCFEVSARTGTSVEELFQDVARKLSVRDERREVHEFDFGDEEDNGRSGLVDLKRRRQGSSSCAC